VLVNAAAALGGSSMAVPMYSYTWVHST